MFKNNFLHLIENKSVTSFLNIQHHGIFQKQYQKNGSGIQE
jgi:hypothetical protein